MSPNQIAVLPDGRPIIGTVEEDKVLTTEQTIRVQSASATIPKIKVARTVIVCERAGTMTVNITNGAQYPGYEVLVINKLSTSTTVVTGGTWEPVIPLGYAQKIQWTGTDWVSGQSVPFNGSEGEFLRWGENGPEWYSATPIGASNADDLPDGETKGITTLAGAEAADDVGAATGDTTADKLKGLVGITAEEVGLTLSGGTTSKTLTVSADADTANIPTEDEKTRLSDIQSATGSTTTEKITSLVPTKADAETIESVQLFDAPSFISRIKLQTTLNVSTPWSYDTVSGDVSGWGVTNVIDKEPGSAQTYKTNMPNTSVVIGYTPQDGTWKRTSYQNPVLNGDYYEISISSVIEKIRIMYVLSTKPLVPIFQKKELFDASKTNYTEPFAGKRLYDVGGRPAFASKKIAGIGDSIMSGWENGGGFLAELSRKYPSATISNLGAGSSTFARNNSVPSNLANKCIYDRIDDLPDDADYIILQGGLNDFFHATTYSIPFGSYSENRYKFPIAATWDGSSFSSVESVYAYGSGTSENLDVETYCGAFEASLVKLLVRYWDKKIGVVISHNPRGTQDIDVYLDVQIELCTKYGIPCLDLRKTACMPRIYRIAANANKTSMYTADGVHPNYYGYRQKYLPSIEQWMEAL